MARIPLNLINTSGRLRAADGDQVAALVESMREVGLINPVTVWKTKVIADNIAVDGYGLVAGLHRIEAATALGWDEIEAYVIDLPDLKRQLAECDENLCGTKLSPAARAQFTQRRKDIYIALHPETRAHVAGAHGSNRAQGNASANLAPAFAADTAQKTGHSERAVQRDVARANRVSEDVLTKITGTDLDKGFILDELAAVPKDKQAARLDELKSAKAARLLTEEQAKEVRKINSATDTIVKDRQVEDALEFLADRLTPAELHQFGILTAGFCPPFSRACMREAA